MFKRVVSTVLALSLLPYVTGCRSVQAVDLTDVEHPRLEWIFGVVTVTGERVDFDEPSNDIRNDTIYATVDKGLYAVSMEQVQQLRLYRTDSGMTVLAVVGSVVVATVAVLVIVGAGFSSLGPEY